MTEENRGDPIPPKVFISYSWACQQFATELACALRTDGVDVKFDRWDLKVGDDKFCFMEQCVVDPAIDKVLILSDKTYAQKANNRNGGVGNETSLISADVYEKSQQQKFIPVVIEKDENGNVFLPAYLKSRMYVDFSSRDLTGAEYQNLLRVVYEKDAVPRPPLGTPPTWLTEEPAVLKTSLSVKSDFQAPPSVLETVSRLSPEARKLLIALSNDERGIVVKGVSRAGTRLVCQGLDIPQKTPRDQAKAGEALEQLITFELVDKFGDRGTAWKINDHGFDVADELQGPEIVVVHPPKSEFMKNLEKGFGPTR